MDAVPYEIKKADVDEVLAAYESTGGNEWPEERRQEARDHVMKHVLELDETIRSASEDPNDALGSSGDRMGRIESGPGERSPARQGMALAAIEDLLIRDGFIHVDAEEQRVFPAAARRGE